MSASLQRNRLRKMHLAHSQPVACSLMHRKGSRYHEKKEVAKLLPTFERIGVTLRRLSRWNDQDFGSDSAPVRPERLSSLLWSCMASFPQDYSLLECFLKGFSIFRMTSSRSGDAKGSESLKEEKHI